MINQFIIQLHSGYSYLEAYRNFCREVVARPSQLRRPVAACQIRSLRRPSVLAVKGGHKGPVTYTEGKPHNAPQPRKGELRPWRHCCYTLNCLGSLDKRAIRR